MKAFLIIYSVLYILLEVAFRTRLLETIGIVSDTSSIESIETLGRLISSLGFAILVASLIKIKKANFAIKLTTFVVVYLISFGGFFVGQKFMINALVASIPNEVKEKALYLQLYKENIYYGNMNSKNFPYTMENKNTSQSKVFLANLPLLNVDNNKYIDYLVSNKSALIEKSVESGVEASDDIILSNWYIATGELNGLYDDFKSIQKSIGKKIKSIAKDSENDFKMLAHYKKDEFRKYRNEILAIFSIGGHISSASKIRGIASTLRSKPDNFSTGYDVLRYDQRGTLFIRKSAMDRLVFHDNGVYERYFLLRGAIDFDKDKIETEKDLADFIYAIENAMVRQIHKDLLFKLKTIDKKLGYKYSDEVLSKVKKLSNNLCKTHQYSKSVKNKGFKNYIHEPSAVVLSDGHEIRRVEINHEILNDNVLNGKRILVCSYKDKVPSFKLILKDIADKYNNVKYGFKRDYTKPVNFFRTKYFRTMLQKQLKNKKMEIPLNFNSGRYSEFKKYYRKSVYENANIRLTSAVASITDMYYSDYIKKYNHVPLNITEKALFELPAIENKVKESTPFLYDTKGRFIHRYRTNEFNHSSSLDKLPTVKDNFAREQKKFLTAFAKDPLANADVLDKYGKALVVPPFVLFISTVMIVVNLISLFWKFVSIKNPKMKVATNVFFFILVVIVPLLFSNTYVDTKYYDRIQKHGTPQLYVLTTIWLQNTNVIFEKTYILGRVFEPLIDKFEVGVLLYEKDSGADRVRKRLLRKKIKN